MGTKTIRACKNSIREWIKFIKHKLYPITQKNYFKKLCIVFSCVCFVLITCLVIRHLPGELLDSIDFSSTVLDKNNKLLRIFLTNDEKFRSFRYLHEFPHEMVEAMLLQEDAWFYTHWGINPVTMVKAFYTTYIAKNRRVGASTISMQTARLLYRIKSNTISGKLKQIVVTFYLELRYSKQEILEAYLNVVPCGRNIEGFPAASWYYFNKDIRSLELSEILFLCVIPQNPTKRSPKKDLSYGQIIIPQQTLHARNILFGKWLEKHPEDTDKQVVIDLPPQLFCAFPLYALHHTEYVKKLIPLSRYAIHTSIDRDIQKTSEDIISRYIEMYKRRGVSNAAMLLLDWKTMELVAAVGSADYFDKSIKGQVNGTIAQRSPGSTLKPFIYAKALEKGLIHEQTMLKDVATSFSEYTPDNYSKDFVGPIKAWKSLVDSRNVPAVSLNNMLKNDSLYELLKKTNLKNLKDKNYYGLSIVLGSVELSMMELAALYAVLPNQGIYKPIKFFTNTLFFKDNNSFNKNDEVRLLSPEASWITQTMLEKNPSVYRNDEFERVQKLAFKTGTSIGFKDAWTVGVWGNYVLVVWLGNFDGYGEPVFSGRALATPLMFNVFNAIISLQGTQALYTRARPDSVIDVDVCVVSGALPTELCGRTQKSWFIPGVSPINRCSIHREIFVDVRTGYRTDDTMSPFTQRLVREVWPSDMLESFKVAGLPRLVPPQYPQEEKQRFFNYKAQAPVVISPLGKSTYILRKVSPEHNTLTLMASADSQTSLVFWFANDTFIGKSPVNEALLWKPQSGAYTITVLDEQGRSAFVDIVVQLRD